MEFLYWNSFDQSKYDFFFFNLAFLTTLKMNFQIAEKDFLAIKFSLPMFNFFLIENDLDQSYARKCF